MNNRYFEVFLAGLVVVMAATAVLSMTDTNLLTSLKADPVKNDLYICKLPYDNTTVRKVLGVSTTNKDVKSLTVGLFSAGGDVVKAVAMLKDADQYMRTLMHLESKIASQIDNVELGSPEWDTLANLKSAMSYRLEHMYDVNVTPISKFKNDCEYISSTDLVNYWKE
jgi:hypothetical protein